METTVDTDILPRSVLDQIDHWLTKFPKEQAISASLPALHIIQEQCGGHLMSEHITALAEYLNVPEVLIMEVATFYSMYEHSPVGKHKICVCTNVSCLLRGSDEVMSHLKEKLGVEIGGTSEDGMFTLKEVECLGACVGAPMMSVDKTYHEHLNSDKIDEILAEYGGDARGE